MGRAEVLDERLFPVFIRLSSNVPNLGAATAVLPAARAVLVVKPLREDKSHASIVAVALALRPFTRRNLQLSVARSGTQVAVELMRPIRTRASDGGDVRVHLAEILGDTRNGGSEGLLRRFGDSASREIRRLREWLGLRERVVGVAEQLRGDLGGLVGGSVARVGEEVHLVDLQVVDVSAVAPGPDAEVQEGAGRAVRCGLARVARGVLAIDVALPQKLLLATRDGRKGALAAADDGGFSLQQCQNSLGAFALGFCGDFS